MTYEQLLAIARRCRGERIETLHGKGFEVFVDMGNLWFEPESSSAARQNSQKSSEEFLERFNATGDRSPGAYQDVTRNASYLLAMIAHDER
ncbi:MAG: hypothetical protein KF812_02085, partial [Fimbriimonadaceae bacterium]|nr:hypothetical protein [Fimbriimonadaceae bacterium]